METKPQSVLALSCLLVLVVGACRPPVSPAIEAEVTVPPTSVPPTMTSGGEQVTKEVIEQPTVVEEEPAITNITIDGDASDWVDRSELFEDPVGDAEEGFLDLSSCYVFVNQNALYLLVEPIDPSAPFVHFDIIFQAGSSIMQYSVGPDQRYGFLSQLSPMEKQIGEDVNSLFTFVSAFEGRVGIQNFGSPEEIKLIAVNVMAGDAATWRAVESWEPEVTSVVNEVDSPFLVSDETRYVLARRYQLPEGYVAEPIYEPEVPDLRGIARSESGIIYLTQKDLNQGVSTLDIASGEVTKILELPSAALHWPVGGPGDALFLGVDQEIWLISPDGSYQIWGERRDGWPQYYSPDGRLFARSNDGTRIIELFPNGESKLIASGFDYVYDIVVDVDGTIFASDYERGDLVRIDPDGTTRTLASDLFNKEVLDLNFDPAGNLYMYGITTGFDLVDKQSGSYTRLDVIPGLGEFVFATEDDILFVNCSESQVYKHTISTGDLDVVVSNRGIYTWAMDIGPDDEVYLGTWGQGDRPAQVVRFGDDGSESVYVDHLEGTVQDITFDQEGGLYVATRVAENYSIHYVPPGGGDLVEIPNSLGGISGLAVDPNSGHLMAAIWQGGLAEYSIDGLIAQHSIQLPKAVEEFTIDIAPDGTLYAYASELERQWTGPEVDRWILRLDIERGTSEIVAQRNRIGCCVMGNLGVDSYGNIWWTAMPDFELYLVTPDGEITQYAKSLPTDSVAVQADSQGDVYISSPAGILRMYKEP